MHVYLYYRLTAFVVKSFAQASDAITIDEDTVINAVRWLVKQQTEMGNYREPGKVLHKAMQVHYRFIIAVCGYSVLK